MYKILLHRQRIENVFCLLLLIQSELSTEVLVASEIVRLIPHLAWTSRTFPQMFMNFVASESRSTLLHRAQVVVSAEAVPPSATHLAWNQVRVSSNAASISPLNILYIIMKTCV
jgi:hypothetical protein